MTDELRESADKCEERALVALTFPRGEADAKVMLEVAMLLDQRADYIETRGRESEIFETRVGELIGIIEQADDACREVVESCSVPPTMADFARDLRDILKAAL